MKTLDITLRERLGEGGVIDDPLAMAPFLEERRGRYTDGRARLVACPASTAEVVAVVQACREAGAPIVSQSGNTGLVGGAAAHARGDEVILSLRRMNRVRALDAANFTMTVEAGCVLEDVQRAALAADRYFPLGLASQAEARIGGNLATNAGGINVLHYGSARDLALGLEVVLADGSVWDGLRGLRKDNSGYNLRDLFIGSEGTLGIITAAVVKLFPRPAQVCTALLALPDARSAVVMLEKLRAASADRMTSCELMSQRAFDFACRHGEGCRSPFSRAYPWYLLVECTTTREGDELGRALAAALDEARASGVVLDVSVAEDAAAGAALWRIRKSIPRAQGLEGGSIKHDVSVPVSAIPEFMREASERVQAAVPGVRVCAFGHVGDGNIHFNLSQPHGMGTEAFMARWDECNRIVHDLAMAMGGSFAAEHGIGRLKPEAVAHYKSPVEVRLMRAVKQALDPDDLLNPGKVVPPPVTP